MQWPRWFIAVCLALAGAFFWLGRWAASTAEKSGTEERPTVSAESPVGNRSIGASAKDDFARVRIENLGQVGFDHAYELIQSASEEALAGWTRRLEALPAGPQRTAGLTAFFRTLAQIDSRKAVDLALGMERTSARWNAVDAITVATSASDLGEVARLYSALNEKGPDGADLVATWSRTDPVRAAAWAAGYPGGVQDYGLAALMANWGALDPVGAGRWLAEAGPKFQDPRVLAGFYSGWVEADFAAAVSDLRERGTDERFAPAIQRVATELFKESPQSTRAYVLALPPGPREAAIDAVVGDVTAIYLGGGPELEIEEVAEWLVTLPDELWRGHIGAIMSQWHDETATEAWLGRLPLQTRDVVLSRVCAEYRTDMPTESFRAGLRISDPQLRERTFREIFQKLEEEERQKLFGALELSPGETRELESLLRP